MIELYISLTLLGLGYFMKKNEKNDSKIKQDGENDNVKNDVQNVKNNNGNNNVNGNNKSKHMSGNKSNNVNNKDSINNKYFKKSAYEDNAYDMVSEIERTRAKIIFEENRKKRSGETHETTANVFYENNKNKSNLSGKYTDMSHNNMTPFFRGNINNLQDKSPLLEKFTGQSETRIKKDAVLPLFVPEQDNISGMKVNTDMYQGRMQQPIIMNNVTPIPKIQVGKGIGNGYNSEPSGGFHQFEERQYVMPKTIDELRAKNNPKETYSGVVLEGQKPVKRAKTPTIKKYKQDQFYKNTPDRYFVTTGEEIKQANKPEIDLKCGARPDTSVEYSGAAYINKKDGSRPNELAPYSTFRQGLKSVDVMNPKLTNVGTGDKNDHGKNSILIYSNERESQVENNYQGNVISLIKSIISPITDALKITKKEYTLEHAREMGQLQSFVQKQTIQPDDVAKTTIKETLLHDSVAINLYGHNKNTIHDPNDIARTTLKETLLQDSETMNLYGHNKNTVYDPNNVARTTIKETLLQDSETMNLYGHNKNTVYDPNNVARTTIKETLLQDSTSINLNGHNKNTVYDPNDIARTTLKETLLQDSESMNLYGHNKNKVYDPNDIARTTLKETLLQDSELMNIDVRRNAAISRNEDIATATIRETLDNAENVINIKPGKIAHLVNDPNDVAKTTIKETTIDSKRDGAIFNSTNAKGAYDDAKFDMKDTHQQYLSQIEYAGNIHVADQDGYKIAPTDLKPTQKESLCDNDYIGNAADQTAREPPSYEAIYNATMNELKEELENNRDPTQSSVKIAASASALGKDEEKKNNIQYESYQTKTYMNQPTYGKMTDDNMTRMRDEYENTRFNSSIVKSFIDVNKENPYNIDLSRTMT